jgi:protein-tyrosine phosphatase
MLDEMIMEYAQILPQLYIGSHPQTTADIDVLRWQLAITAVMNLQTDEDMAVAGLRWDPLEAYYPTVGIQLYRFPMKEEQSVLQEKLAESVRVLENLLAQGHTVYLHCTEGIGRCPTVAIGYLHSYKDLEMDAAVAHVKLSRKCAPHIEALQIALGSERKNARIRH